MQKPSYEQAERQEKIRIERALLRAMTIERSSIVWEREINKFEFAEVEQECIIYYF